MLDFYTSMWYNIGVVDEASIRWVRGIEDESHQKGVNDSGAKNDGSGAVKGTSVSDELVIR